MSDLNRKSPMPGSIRQSGRTSPNPNYSGNYSSTQNLSKGLLKTGSSSNVLNQTSKIGTRSGIGMGTEFKKRNSAAPDISGMQSTGQRL